MRIVITQNMTLDGRIEMLDGWFDPSDQDAELAEEIRRQSAEEEILLLGRQTFTDFRGYWPHQHDDTTGVADQLNRIDKRVVSSTMTDPQWENSSIVGGDVLAEVRRLREADGGDVIITGSIQLAHAVIAAELADEYRMFVYPYWQGRGRGFFPDDRPAAGLRLLRSQGFGSGVVYMSYSPVAGDRSAQAAGS